MSQQRTLVDEAAELIDCLTVEQKKQLFMRIPGMQSRVLKSTVRFIYKAPIKTGGRSRPTRSRVRYDEVDDIIK